METESISQMWLIGISSAIAGSIVAFVIQQYIKNIKTMMKKEINIKISITKIIIFVIKYPLPFGAIMWIEADRGVPLNKFTTCAIATSIAFIFFCIIMDLFVKFFGLFRKTLNLTHSLVSRLGENEDKKVENNDPHFPKH
jgi:hypothetical protein